MWLTSKPCSFTQGSTLDSTCRCWWKGRKFQCQCRRSGCIEKCNFLHGLWNQTFVAHQWCFPDEENRWSFIGSGLFLWNAQKTCLRQPIYSHLGRNSVWNDGRPFCYKKKTGISQYRSSLRWTRWTRRKNLQTYMVIRLFLYRYCRWSVLRRF